MRALRLRGKTVPMFCMRSLAARHCSGCRVHGQPISFYAEKCPSTFLPNLQSESPAPDSPVNAVFGTVIDSPNAELVDRVVDCLVAE